MENNSIRVSKQLAFLATIAFSFLLAIIIASENVFAATLSQSVTGYYKQLEARAVEYYMNRDRKSGDGFYIDSNGVKHAAAKDHDIIMDANLEAVARQRAAELVLNYNYVRPNGKSFDTLAVNSMRSYQEYIFQMPVASAGKDSSLDAYANWFNVGKGPAGFSMMSNNFKSCGCACFVYEGTEYWVLEFSIQASTNAVLPNISTANTSVTVEYDNNTVKTSYKISNPKTTSIKIGEDIGKSNFTFTEYLGNYKIGVVNTAYISCTVTSSNSNIAKINGSSVQGRAAGKCTVTFTFTYNNGGISKSIGTSSFSLTVTTISITNTFNYYNNEYCYDLPSQTYTGKELKPSFTLKYGDITLKEGDDYTVKYSDNVNAGRATITVTGTGKNFTGTKTINFFINAIDITNATVSIPATSYAYTGAQVTPAVTVKLANGQVLTLDKDYDVRYSDNTNIGTATIKIYGKNNYTGTLTKTFTITKANLANASVKSIEDYIYTGSAIEPPYTFLYLPGNSTVSLGEDNYTVTYKNNVNVGTATITFTGKNNCTGTKEVTFKILPHDFKNGGWLLLDEYYLTYTGSEIKPSIQSFTWGDINLKLGTDYTVSYSNNVNVGEGTVTVTGKGNYTGTASRTFTIRQKDISSLITVSGITDCVATGKQITFSNMVVKFDGVVVKEGIDYKVSYGTNVNAGTGKVYISPLSPNFKGSKTIEFTITPADFTKATATLTQKSVTYTHKFEGNKLEPVVTWTDGSVLTKNVDYTLFYTDAGSAGTAKITITGMGAFAGQITTTYTIDPADINTLTVEDIPDMIYTGSVIYPDIKVKLPDAGAGWYLSYAYYDVSYRNNLNAGTATVTISGKGNYTGSITKTFKILPASMTTSLELNEKSYVYTGKEIKPTFQKIVFNDYTLREGKDYDVTYSSNTDIGTGKVTVTFKGNYTGTTSATFQITQASINEATISGVKDHIAIGSAITYPELVVELNGVPLKSGTDYSISYKNNVEPGKATVIITGKGNCTGKFEAQFTITPATTRSKGVAAFVERLYTVALNRSYDPYGKQAWFDALMNGADGATVANGFFFSPELVGQNLSNEEFVKRLYLTFMDRQPDAGGFNAWVKALNEGATRAKVFSGFINSTEWANICLEFGIKSGGTGTPSIRIEPNTEILAFTSRLYSTCLGRPADASGLMAWASALANHEGTGAKVAHGFFFSKELTDQKLSNREFVTRLYKTFLDRNPDSAGLSSWTAALNGGASREQVFNGFAQSAEFVALCNNAGIDPY